MIGKGFKDGRILLVGFWGGEPPLSFGHFPAVRGKPCCLPGPHSPAFAALRVPLRCAKGDGVCHVRIVGWGLFGSVDGGGWILEDFPDGWRSMRRS